MLLPAFLAGELPPTRGKLVEALIDAIPVLSVFGSQVTGGLEVSEARELRFKESDRLSALARNLRAMGAEVEEMPDGLRIRGGQGLRGAGINTRGHPRIAMAVAVARLETQGATRIHA